MTVTLPTRKDIKFLLAEDVRQEMAGKFSLLGIYPGNSFSVGGEAPPASSGLAFVIPSLAFTFIFAPHSRSGKCRGQLTLIAPDNRTVVGKSALDSIEFKADQAAVVIKTAKPFAGPAYGTYTVLLEIGSTKFKFPFTVERMVAPKGKD